LAISHSNQQQRFLFFRIQQQLSHHVVITRSAADGCAIPNDWLLIHMKEGIYKRRRAATPFVVFSCCIAFDLKRKKRRRRYSEPNGNVTAQRDDEGNCNWNKINVPLL
jgi:hypothetical protein